jgi:hypothetical protein
MGPTLVTIDTITIGQCFGTTGRVRTLDGRVLHETQVCPYGFTAAAIGLATYWANNHGCKLAEEE